MINNNNQRMDWKKLIYQPSNLSNSSRNKIIQENGKRMSSMKMGNIHFNSSTINNNTGSLYNDNVTPNSNNANITTLLPIYCFLLSLVIIIFGGYVIYKFVRQYQNNRFSKSNCDSGSWNRGQAKMGVTNFFQSAPKHPVVNKHDALLTASPISSPSSVAAPSWLQSDQKLDEKIQSISPNTLDLVIVKYGLTSTNCDNSRSAIIKSWVKQCQPTNPILFLVEEVRVVCHENDVAVPGCCNISAISASASADGGIGNSGGGNISDVSTSAANRKAKSDHGRQQIVENV